MNCDQLKQSINAYVDSQVSSEIRADIEMHIQQCHACRQLAEELKQLDNQLRDAIRGDRPSTRSVADRVINQLSVQQREAKPSNLHFWNLVMAMAAGFLLALIVWKPWEKEVIHQPLVLPSESVAVPVAQLAVATGPVEVSTDSKNWLQCRPSSSLNAGDMLRTANSELCEIQTQEKATIRMASDTRVCIVDDDNVKLEQGRLWCSTEPNQKRLDVTTPHGCVSFLGKCDIQQSSSTTEILLIEGEASVKSKTDEKAMSAPQCFRIVDSKVIEAPLLDPFFATSWINDLLVEKGESNPELDHRVNRLLADIGRAKMKNLYESELRSLGPSCAKPIGQFIISCPDSPGETWRRQNAARILADVAGKRAIPELLQLLNDSNGEVRFHAARCLIRLTGQRFGKNAQAWRTMQPKDRESIIKKWKGFVNKNSPS